MPLFPIPRVDVPSGLGLSPLSGTGLQILKRGVHTALMGAASLRIEDARKEDHSLRRTVGGGVARGVSTTLDKSLHLPYVVSGC